jgi:hypothetical protein
MTDLTETETNILARYFCMGKGSEIISHPPHHTIGLHRHAFDRLIEIGMLKVEPFNQFGVKRITCTDEAAKIGHARMLENLRHYFDDASALSSQHQNTGE